MLTFAIASFFALSLIGGLLVIGTMFWGYRGKIETTILGGLRNQHAPIVVSVTQRNLNGGPSKLGKARRRCADPIRSFQPVQQRVAA